MVERLDVPKDKEIIEEVPRRSSNFKNQNLLIVDKKTYLAEDNQSNYKQANEQEAAALR